MSWLCLGLEDTGEPGNARRDIDIGAVAALLVFTLPGCKLSKSKSLDSGAAKPCFSELNAAINALITQVIACCRSATEPRIEVSLALAM